MLITRLLEEMGHSADSWTNASIKGILLTGRTNVLTVLHIRLFPAKSLTRFHSTFLSRNILAALFPQFSLRLLVDLAPWSLPSHGSLRYLFSYFRMTCPNNLSCACPTLSNTSSKPAPTIHILM